MSASKSSSFHMPAVSVVVPMYNVERYLDTCVASIAAQSLLDIEIILVNDGSPDGSEQIARQWAAKDSRIKVVCRENGGLGPARNTGIEHATGEYVAFVDSDDWIDPDMLARLYSRAKEVDADMCCTGHRRVTDGVVVEKHPHPLAGRVMRTDDELHELRISYYGALPDSPVDDATPVSVCLAVYKNALLKEHPEVRFPAARSEDVLFHVAFLRYVRAVAFIDGVPYCYRKDGQASITSRVGSKAVAGYLDFFERLLAAADAESDACRNECILRSKRRVVAYTRSFAVTLHARGVPRGELVRVLEDFRGASVVDRALADYPWQKLPTGHALFFIALRHQWYGAIWMMLWLRNRR